MTKPKIQYRRDLWRLFTHIPIDQLGGAAEVGVAEGNFSEDMLSWSIKFPFVHMVDRWRHIPNAKGDSNKPQEWHDNNYGKAVARTAKFGARASVLKCESAEAASLVGDRHMSLVYIDADHSYFGVRADIRVWYPKLKAGGVMAFHDYENSAYGVKKAVEEFCHHRNIEIFLLPEDKEEDAGAYFYVDTV